MKLRKKIRNNIKIAYESHITEAESSLLADPKKFWSFTNSFKNESKIPCPMSHGNLVLDTPEKIAAQFGVFFDSVYSASSGPSVIPVSHRHLGDNI